MKTTATKTRRNVIALLLAAVLTTACSQQGLAELKAKEDAAAAERKAARDAQAAAEVRERVLHAEKAALGACKSDMIEKLERIHTRNIPAFGPDKVTNLGEGKYKVETRLGAMPVECSFETADGKIFKRTKEASK